MSWIDYRIKTRDIFESLHFLQEGQSEVLKQYISSQWRLLSLLEESPSTLHILADPSVESTAFALQEVDGKWQCVESSNSELIGENFDGYLTIEARGTFALLKEPFKSFPKSLLLGKNFGNRFLLISIPIKAVLQKIMILSKKGMILSIVTNKDEVFASTNPLFEGKAIKMKHHFQLMSSKYFIDQIKLYDLNFRLVLADSYASVYEAFAHSMLILGLLLLWILIMGGFGVYFLTKRFSKPLYQLSSVIKKVGKGNLEARYKKDALGFEINGIGSLFNQMIESLILYIEVAKNERVKKETLEKELHIGQEVQKSLIPEGLPQIEGIELASSFSSAKEVGGDFYDIFVKEIPGKEKLFITIADTSGKGIFACLYALSMRSIFRSFESVFDDLESIILSANNLFCKDTKDSGVFVTTWMGLYDKKTKMLEYSSCGHLPGFLRRSDGSVEKLITPGIALGVVPLDQITTAKIKLHGGDSLILYTDGIVEAQNVEGEFFKEDRLVHIIAKGALNAKEFVNNIIDEIAVFSKGVSQYDDIALVILKVSNGETF